MKDNILLGRGEKIVEIPAEHWRKQLARHDTSAAFSFMTDDHRRVRNFAVRELPRNDGKPLSPEDIASRLKLSLPRIIRLLEDLEQHLFFLVRNERGEISWAFPVTSDRTPHGLNFSSGEHGFAA